MTETRLLLAFDGLDALIAAARQLRDKGVTGMDAHTPWHMEELDDLLALPRSKVRPVMLVAALVVALGMYLLQWWSATVWYPINSGGRPLNSWPTFMFATFETGILTAAFAGLVTSLASCGLPRLNHPFFVQVATEAASDDAQTRTTSCSPCMASSWCGFSLCR